LLHLLSIVQEGKTTSGGAAAPSIPMVQEGEATSAAAAAPSMSTVEKAPGLFSLAVNCTFEILNG